MFRSAISRRPNPTCKAYTRHFHLSPRRQADSLLQSSLIETPYLSHAVPFHNLFQQTHELTTLPWILSIPLTVILFRSFVTPVRVYLALKRNDQALATPRLEHAATLVKKQAEIRLATGTDTIAQNNEWKARTWEKKRAEIEHIFKFMKPSLLLLPGYKTDITASLMWFQVAINTSTILALSWHNPEFHELQSLEQYRDALCILFACMAVSNTSYFRRRSFYRLLKQFESEFYNFPRWNRDMVQGIAVYLAPLYAATDLVFCPTAVIVFALSNSGYTLIERICIERFIGNIAPPPNFGVKASLQSTQPRSLDVQTVVNSPSTDELGISKPAPMLEGFNKDMAKDRLQNKPDD